MANVQYEAQRLQQQQHQVMEYIPVSKWDSSVSYQVLAPTADTCKWFDHSADDFITLGGVSDRHWAIPDRRQRCTSPQRPWLAIAVVGKSSSRYVSYKPLNELSSAIPRGYVQWVSATAGQSTGTPCSPISAISHRRLMLSLRLTVPM